MKYAIWGAIIVLVVMWILRSKATSRSKSGRPVSPEAPAAPKKPVGDETESMLRCAECGTYIPVSEAILTQPGSGSVGPAYCSQEHRLKHTSR